MSQDRDTSSQSAPHGADSHSKATYGEDIRNLKSSARSTVRGGVDSLTAMRRLAMAELNLSRHAVGRSVVWLAVGIVFGASFWLFLMAGSVVAMHDKLGWSWLISFLVAAGVSLVVTLIGAMRVRHFFQYTGLKATRTELARFGIGEEDDDDAEKPSFAYLQKRVDRAELVAEGRRQQTMEAYATMRQQARDTVTPGRVVAAGALSGYLVGRRNRRISMSQAAAGVEGRVRRTGLAARSALYTTDMAIRGFSEIAQLAITTFAAFKSADAAASSEDAAADAADAAQQSEVAADAAVDTAVSVDSSDAGWNVNDLSPPR